MNHSTGFMTGIYRDQNTGRQRWAVIGPSNVWYFPKQYGRIAARALCRKLNRKEYTA